MYRCTYRKAMQLSRDNHTHFIHPNKSNLKMCTLSSDLEHVRESASLTSMVNEFHEERANTKNAL